MEQVDGLFPHLPCRLKAYSAQDLRQCVLERDGQGSKTKLLVMGDSTVRQLVETFLEVFRDLKFKITTHEVRRKNNRRYTNNDVSK